MASSRLGRRTGAHRSHRDLGFSCALCNLARRLERGELSGCRNTGRQAQRMVWHQPHPARYQPERPSQRVHGAYRSLRLRKIHLRSLPEWDARDQPHRQRHRLGAIGDLNVYGDTKPVEIRRRVGMVFQRPNPFPTMSIYDNVASGLKLNGFATAASSTKSWSVR